eukprot:s359_g32.t1
MGVPSKAQVQAAKADALAAANKTGRHRRVLTKKKLKHERNQIRNKRKREKSQSVRGRASEATTVSSTTSTQSRSFYFIGTQCARRLSMSKLKLKQESKPLSKVAPG